MKLDRVEITYTVKSEQVKMKIQNLDREWSHSYSLRTPKSGIEMMHWVHRSYDVRKVTEVDKI